LRRALFFAGVHMKKICLFLSFIFLCGAIYAQDYYMTADKNKTPLKVGKISEVQSLMASSGKSKKYQFVLLSFSNGQGVFVLAPISFNQELSPEGVTFTDKKNEDYTFDINVKNSSAKAGEDLNAFKTQALSAKAQLTSESSIVMNGNEVKQIFFDMPDASRSAAFMTDYRGKNLLFMTQGGKKNIALRVNALKKVILSLGTLQADSSAAAPVAAVPAAVSSNTAPAAVVPAAVATVNVAAPSANPALAALQKSGLKDLQDDVYIQSLKVLSQSRGRRQIIFRYGTSSFSAAVSSNLDVSLDDGRLLFKLPRRPKNVFFMEIVSPRSKPYYASLLRKNGEGHAFKSQGAKREKLGVNSVNVLTKDALSKKAVNYFFKQNGIPFVVSYIADTDDNMQYAQMAEDIISSLRAK